MVFISGKTSFPSDSRSTVGAQSPRNARCHQKPRCSSAPSVNQYCQITARICRGGPAGKGLPAKSESTEGEPVSSRSATWVTNSFCRQLSREADQRFQSKRG